MARKYTRDNRGRFASGGGGATARGGRLRTASGNKRATQTMKAGKRATPDGAIRTTDVNKAKVHNAVSKIVQANQAKGNYDQNRNRPEGKLSRLMAAEKRVAARAKPAAKAPREQRLERAIATAARITEKRQAKAKAEGDAFANRRAMTRRSSSKGRWSAIQKEEAAGARSAQAMRSWLRANSRAEGLRAARNRR